MPGVLSVESLLAANPASLVAFGLTLLLIGALSWLSRFLRARAPRCRPRPASVQWRRRRGARASGLQPPHAAPKGASQPAAAAAAAASAAAGSPLAQPLRAAPLAPPPLPPQGIAPPSSAPVGMSHGHAHGAAADAPHAHAEPVVCGDITLEQLAQFDGRDPSKPLYLACLGDVYDVTRGMDFYGPEGPYNKFAGREANRALAKMSLEEADCIPDTAGLSLAEMDVLRDWKAKFEGKYFKVGKVVAAGGK